MGEALETVAEMLRESEWTFAPLEGDVGLVTTYRCPAGEWDVVVLDREEAEQLLVYSVYAKPVPEPRLAEVMEFITRANCNLPIGNFELDLGDGELRFKSSVDLEGGVLTPAMARMLVHTNIKTMEFYALGIMEVLAGLAAPAEAIAACEEAPLD